jgi:beta-fructofuranosidase
MKRRNFLFLSALGATHAALPAVLRQAGQPSDAAALRERLSGDRLRPQYHLLPQAGFLGDPCAPRFYRGKYHAFFHGSFSGRGWQHAVSPDLVHWQHMPIALTPTDGSYDAYGTFTGSMLPSDEGASIVYTGVTKVDPSQETIRNEGLREQQCIAVTSDADLREFHKLAAPVIEHPPEDLKVTGFRDPFSWKEGDAWYMGVGSGVSKVGGMVLLYRSSDARHWEYVHPLAAGVWNGKNSSNPVPSGEMWECPDFFALGDKHVLLYSTGGETVWEVGSFDYKELRFHSEKKGVLDHGAYYAPKSMLDGRGRRVLWAWVQETRPREESVATGWAGCMSLPRVLTLGQDGGLEIVVAPEMETLCENRRAIKTAHRPGDLQRALEQMSVPGRAGLLRLRFTAGEKAWGLGLRLGAAENPTSIVALHYAGRADGQPALMVGDKAIPISPDASSHSEVLVWIDGSVLEVLVDRRHAVTSRSYARPSDSGPVGLAWSGSPESLIELSVAGIRSISPDRLTS